MTHKCEFPMCRCHCARPTLNDFCQSGRCQCPKTCPSCTKKKELTLFDFSVFKSRVSNDFHAHYSEGDFTLYIVKDRESFRVSASIKNELQRQGTVKTLNAALEAANKLYIYFCP